MLAWLFIIRRPRAKDLESRKITDLAIVSYFVPLNMVYESTSNLGSQTTTTAQSKCQTTTSPRPICGSVRFPKQHNRCRRTDRPSFPADQSHLLFLCNNNAILVPRPSPPRKIFGMASTYASIDVFCVGLIVQRANILISPAIRQRDHSFSPCIITHLPNKVSGDGTITQH